MMTSMRPSDAAMHEAGHAVVAAYYGDRGWRVSIVADGASLGRFTSHHGAIARTGNPALDCVDGMKCCRVALAGGIAETFGTRRHSMPRVSDTDAQLYLRGLELREITGRSLWPHFDALAVRTLFRRRAAWEVVLRLASELDLEEEIDIHKRHDLFDGLPLYLDNPRDDVVIKMRSPSVVIDVGAVHP